MNTIHAQWWAQNDATNADGFLMNSQDDGEAVFTAEREALREMGAPDTDSIEFEFILPEDRDSATAVGMVTPALWEWMRANIL